MTSRFRLRGGGRLGPGTDVTWRRDMYGFSVPAAVKEVERDRRIVVEWPIPTRT